MILVMTFISTGQAIANIAGEPEPAEVLTTDVCIVGAGSAGCAAAIAAAREGAQVVIVEKMKLVGGTGVNGFVSSWEGGPGCDIAEEFYSRMKAINGAGVAKMKVMAIPGPYGTRLIDRSLPEEPYSISLVRAKPPKGDYRSVPYLPEAFDRIVREIFAETKKITLLDKTEFFQAEKNSDRTLVDSILVRRSDQKIIRIKAAVFIDCTGSVVLCRALDCSVRIGREGKAEYQESLAPDKADVQLNAITRCYRIEPKKNPRREIISKEDILPFPKAAWITGWLDGPRFINMMAMMQGEEIQKLGYEECMKRSEKIVRNHWHWLQQSPDFSNYELVAIAPLMGIREDYRVITQYVLREKDLRDTWERQTHTDMIAVADHPCDIHGKGGGLVPVVSAYGIPFRCLVPEGTLKNILVACRGAGFSHIAAASCRLQRTMIQLGHVAGVAAAWAAQKHVTLDKIDVSLLVKKMDARNRYPSLK